MTGTGERIAWRHALIGIALEVLAAEHSLSDDETSTGKLLDAEERLDLAARDLTNCVDDLPPTAWPRGWRTTPDVLPPSPVGEGLTP